MKLKILNLKKGEKRKEKIISLLKALDLFLWHQVQLLALFLGVFSMSLFLLKVGMCQWLLLHCVEQFKGELTQGFELSVSLVS
jgi:hypothetical protein